MRRNVRFEKDLKETGYEEMQKIMQLAYDGVQMWAFVNTKNTEFCHQINNYKLFWRDAPCSELWHLPGLRKGTVCLLSGVCFPPPPYLFSSYDGLG
jgi:hypothetical protein